MKKLIAAVLVLALTLSLGACADKNEKSYKAAVKLYNAEKYAEAKTAFKQLGDYEDSAIRVQKCDYEMATAMFLKGDYLGAQEALEAMNGFKNSAELAQTCSYLLAQEAVQNGKYSEAAQRLSELGDFRDSQALLAELNQMELVEKVQGTWTASLGDLTQTVLNSMKQVEVTALENPEEESEEYSEEEETEETEEEESEEEESEEEAPKEPTSMDLSAALSLKPVEAAVKLELLPNGAFAMQIDGGLENMLETIRRDVQSQLLKLLENEVKEKMGELTIQSYLQENGFGSMNDYAAARFGQDIEVFLDQYVDEKLLELIPELPVYGAYRVEGKNVILAVGAQETTGALDETGAKLPLTLDPAGTVEFSK